MGGPVAFKKFNSFRGPGRIAVRHGAAFSSITNRPDILIFIISLFKNKNVYISFTEQSSCQRVPIWAQLMSWNGFLNRLSRCRQRRLRPIRLPKSFTTNLLNRTRWPSCPPTERLSTATCNSCEPTCALDAARVVVVKRKIANHFRVPFIPQNDCCLFVKLRASNSCFDFYK